MKKLAVYFIPLLITSCVTLSPQEKVQYLIGRVDSNLVTKVGRESFQQVREALISEGGETPDFSNRLIEKCYDAPYSQEGGCTFNAYYDALQQIRQEKVEELCLKTPSCVRQKEINKQTSNLNLAYRMGISMFPYDQANVDMLIREACSTAGEAQRLSKPLSTVIDYINMKPGLAPNARYVLSNVVQACWRLSSYGINDGNSKLVPMY